MESSAVLGGALATASNVLRHSIVWVDREWKGKGMGLEQATSVCVWVIGDAEAVRDSSQRNFEAKFTSR